MSPEAQRIAIDAFYELRYAVAMNNRSSQVHERFWSMVSVQETLRCWPWRGVRDMHGYGQFRMEGKTVRAPRVAFFLRNGKWPNQCCHRCDNPECCNPDHLFDGSRHDNMQDMARKGRQKGPRGETHGRAVLNEEKVAAMRASYREGGVSLKEVAEEYGCSFSTAQRVIKRTNWKHV